MEASPEDVVRSWLLKANSDLVAARELSGGRVPVPDVAIYHCQQAGEKALKGLIAFFGERPEKTHDLARLIERIVVYRPLFAEHLGEAAELTQYVWVFRYPGDRPVPEKEELATALRTAQRLYAAVLAAVPPACHPPGTTADRRSREKRRRSARE